MVGDASTVMGSGMKPRIVAKARVKARAAATTVEIGTAIMARVDHSGTMAKASAKALARAIRASPGVTTKVRAALLLCFYPCLASRLHSGLTVATERILCL